MKRPVRKIRQGLYHLAQRTLRHRWASFLLDFMKRFKEIAVVDRAASTSYYMLFAIFPFLIFIFIIGGQVVNVLAPDLLESSEIQAVIPDGLRQLIAYIRPLVGNFNYGRFVFVGIISLVVACSKGFAQIIGNLYLTYGRERIKSNYFLSRLFGILISLIVGLVLIVLLLILSFSQVVLQWVINNLRIPFLQNSTWVNWTASLISLAVLTVFFGFALYSLAGRQGRLKHAFACGGIISIGWSLATAVLSTTLVRSQRYTLLYGSLAGIMLILLWIFVSMIVLYSGTLLHATWLYWRGNLKEKEDEEDPDLIHKLKKIEAEVVRESTEEESQAIKREV